MKKLRLRWSLRAKHDLLRIKAFIAFDKPVAAANFIVKVRKSVERLADFPRSGRVVAEIGRDDFREIIIGNYRIVYRVEPGQILIVTVFESHALFKSSAHS